MRPGRRTLDDAGMESYPVLWSEFDDEVETGTLELEETGIRLEGGTLTLECNSRERLAIGRQLLEKHAGAYLRHIEDKTTSMDELMQRADSAAPLDPGKLPTEAEREVILAELRRSHHNMSMAAKSLGLERSHLYKKAEQLGIDLQALRREHGAMD